MFADPVRGNKGEQMRLSTPGRAKPSTRTHGHACDCEVCRPEYAELRQLQQARDTLNLELTRLLETGAYFAQKWHAGRFVVIDRTGDAETADIRVCLAERLVDLWEINPVLWDDMHWAALRLVRPGSTHIVYPVLHRD